MHVLGVEVVWPVATCSALLATILSVSLMASFILFNKSRWEVKQCVLFIIFMVPVYAVNARACLRQAANHHFIAEVYTMVRELYEALVMIAFVQLVLFWLGGARKVGKAFQESMQRPQHVWFTMLEKTGDGGRDFAQWLRAGPVGKFPMPFAPGLSLMAGLLTGVLQYSLVSLTVTLMDLCIWAFFAFVQDGDLDSREESMLRWMKLPQVLKTASVGVAFYGLFLMLFELERNETLKERFEEINPHAKFWCIKLLVLATALQKVLFETVLPRFGVWQDEAKHLSTNELHLTADEVGGAVQNWLLCLELFFFAVAHFLVFPVHDLEEREGLQPGPQSKLVPGLFGMLKQVQSLRTEAEEQQRLFKKLTASHKSGAKLTDAEKEECWQTFDSDHNGYITKEELGFVLELTGHDEAQINQAFEHMDRNRDGKIVKSELMNHNFLTGVACYRVRARENAGLREALLV